MPAFPTKPPEVKIVEWPSREQPRSHRTKMNNMVSTHNIVFLFQGFYRILSKSLSPHTIYYLQTLRISVKPSALEGVIIFWRLVANFFGYLACLLRGTKQKEQEKAKHYGPGNGLT
jgi:hypothetical protein